MSHEFEFNGKNVLVVGGSSGIGNAVARAFLEKGASVHVWGTRADASDYAGSNGNPRQIIFLTGHGDIAMTVKAMKAGAVDFFTKPVRHQTLLDAVTAAIEKDVSQRTAARLVKQHVDSYARLTPREREVLREVAKGRLNKQIAFDLGISEITVKLHRGNATRKMQATSVGQLIRIWELLPAELRERKSA
jgi:FixJ family two-component response regulator